MSYCRAGGPDSDVYAYATGSGFEIWAGGEQFHEDTLAGFKTRLELLRDAGLRVPQSAFDRIARELHSEISAEK